MRACAGPAWLLVLRGRHLQPPLFPALTLLPPTFAVLQADRQFLGVCLGMQLLFEGSEESGGCEGLGLIPGMVGTAAGAQQGQHAQHGAAGGRRGGAAAHSRPRASRGASSVLVEAGSCAPRLTVRPWRPCLPCPSARCPTLTRAWACRCRTSGGTTSSRSERRLRAGGATWLLLGQTTRGWQRYESCLPRRRACCPPWVCACTRCLATLPCPPPPPPQAPLNAALPSGRPPRVLCALVPRHAHT